MPEGPSILILKEEVAAFVNKEVVEAGGYAPVVLFRIRVHPASRVEKLPLKRKRK